MTPRELIDTKVAPCRDGGGHVWQATELYGCTTCCHHEGFACEFCHRVVDYELDTPLFEAIASLGYVKEALDESDTG